MRAIIRRVGLLTTVFLSRQSEHLFHRQSPNQHNIARVRLRTRVRSFVRFSTDLHAAQPRNREGNNAACLITVCETQTFSYDFNRRYFWIRKKQNRVLNLNVNDTAE